MGPANLTNYSTDPTHVHDSLRSCKVCWPIRRAQIHKKNYNKFVSDDARYAVYLEHAAARKRATYAKKPSLCRSCGQPRRPKKWYCDECIKAFRDWTMTSYKSKRRKQGKDDPKAAYQRRVAKYGRAVLAEKHRKYDARKRAERVKKNERVQRRQAKATRVHDGDRSVVPVAA